MSAEVPEAASAEEQKVSVREGPGVLRDQVCREPWLAGPRERGLSEAGLEPSPDGSSRKLGGPQRLKLNDSLRRLGVASEYTRELGLGPTLEAQVYRGLLFAQDVAFPPEAPGPLGSLQVT